MMRVRMTGAPLDSLPRARIQQLPCTIHHSGKANVAQRFDPYIEKDEEGTNNAYFRGYPLKGAEIDVPSGYKGIVFTSTSDGNHGQILKSKSTFEKLTYYNWSSSPSMVDPQQSVQEWLSIAEAIHAD